MLEIKSIKPMYNGVVTTADVYKEDDKKNGLIMSDKTAGTLKEYQTVLRIGSSVREVKEGDVVLINPTRFMVKNTADNSIRDEFIKPSYHIAIPRVQLVDKEVLLINESDIAYVIEDSKEVEDNSKTESTIIDTTASSLILPKQKPIIL